MRVFGIDCGTERTGYGVIDSDGRMHHLVLAGCITSSARDPLELRLLHIAGELRRLIDEHRPDSAAIEEVFFAVNAKSALKLSHVRGVAMLVVAEATVQVAEYSPLEVKKSVVGYGRAEKSPGLNGWWLPCSVSPRLSLPKMQATRLPSLFVMRLMRSCR